ncbi:MAG: Rrf2 family transcriptional regulator [Capsulimonadaceae bacterium]|nr:Rrf2 family transcriptional regulator [Capsulimonadaceae bacterium]
MISQTAEYALRAVIHLAMNTSEPQTTQMIARSTHVSLPYLSKVLQELNRAGIVHSQRGLHGGFALAISKEDLSVLDVINVIDPIPRIKRCPLGIDSHDTDLCQLHRRLDEAVSTLEGAFRETTIAELVNADSSNLPLIAGAAR